MVLVIIGQRGDIMNKKKIAIITMAVTLAAAVVIVLCFEFIERPAFSNIKKDEIVSVEYFPIYCYQDGKPVYLPFADEEIDELLEVMQNIKIKGFGTYNHVNSNGGVCYMFKIQMNNGEIIEFAERNPYIIINGKYYISEYSQTEALGRIWSEYTYIGREEYELSKK